MYKSFYHLNRKPFQISSDPAFMWFGEKHKEALATLKYGILDNKGFLLLTGDVGTGKTTLINSLIQSLSDDIIYASVPDPGLEKMDFFNYIAASFGTNHEFTSKGTFLAYFRRFLMDASDSNKKVLLIIDEAQLLTQEMLEEIRLLSNIEKMDAKLINIFFIGQNEFNEILNREQNRAVRQRLTLNYNIDPLTPDETGEYIKHRLKVSGAEQPIFDASAIQEVFMYSGGFPRRINIICDHSLLSGYVKEQKIINAAIVSECAKELKIPAFVKNRDINGFANYYERPAPVAAPMPSTPSQPGRIETMEMEARHLEARKIEERRIEKLRGGDRKKKWLQYILAGMVCLVFIFSAWFFVFPEDYKTAAMFISRNVEDLKYKFVQMIPQSPTSPLKQEKIKTDIMKNDKIVTKEVINQGEAVQTIDTPVTTQKIQIIEEGIIKEGEKRNMIQPQEGGELTTDHLGKKNQPDLSDIEIIKEILPLPKEKITVRFNSNSNDFAEEDLKKMADFANIIITYPGVNLLISGYTDSGGSPTYNQKLSEFRANIVKSFFLGRGIKNDQIQIKGLGSQNPIEDNETAWGRKMNRRVEIEIIEG